MNEEINEQEVENESIVEEVAEPVVQEEQEKQDFSHNALNENIKNLREAKNYEAERAAKAEYERDQLAKYLENMQQQINGGQPVKKDDLGLQDDDYVEGKHLGKVNSELKKVRNELNQWKQYSEETTAELKLNNEFSDFNNIVNENTVQEFIKKYPEMRSSIVNNEPLYNRGKVTYKLIKKFMGNDLNKKANKSNQSAIQNNTNKPRPTAAIKEQQNSPLSQANRFANGYNKDVAKALEKEMYDIISQY